MTDFHFELDQAAQDLLFREAHTPNAFTDEPVTDEQIAQVYDLVKWAPTSMNLQPLRVLEVRSPEQREVLVGHMSGGNQAKTKAAPLTLVFAADLDFHEHAPEQYPVYKDARDMFESLGREGRAAAAKLNASLSIAYWIIGLRAAGLDVGPMTGADFEGIARDFFPGEQLVPLVVANVGHADPESFYPRNSRLSLDQVVKSV